MLRQDSMNLPFFVHVSGTVVSDWQHFWVGYIVDQVEQGRCTSLLQNLETVYIDFVNYVHIKHTNCFVFPFSDARFNVFFQTFVIVWVVVQIFVCK